MLDARALCCTERACEDAQGLMGDSSMLLETIRLLSRWGGGEKDGTCFELSREFFFDRVQERVEVKGLFKGPTGTEEFGDVQEIVVALRSRDGDHFGVHVFTRELKRSLKAVRFRHQQVHDHKVYRFLLIEHESFASVLCFQHTMSRLHEDFFQKPSDRWFVVND